MAATEKAGHPGVIAGRSVDDNQPNDVNVDPTSGAIYVAVWSWDAVGLAWEKVDIGAKLDEIITLLDDIKTNTTP